jgi:hypothetical protein
MAASGGMARRALAGGGLACLVAAVGACGASAGQSAAPARTLTASPASAASQPATRRIYVSPVDSRGEPAAGVRVTRTAGNASCEPGSEVVIRAYRCFAGNTVYDPCWAEARVAGAAVLCLPAPWSAGAARLSVTGRLARVPGGGSEPPWGLQLRDGRRCIEAQGSHDLFRGRAVDYYCGGQMVVLHGFRAAGARLLVQTAVSRGGGYRLGPVEGVTIAWYGKPGAAQPNGA